MIKNHNLFKTVPIFLFLILVTTPMLIMPRDMWDGIIIEYASMIKDFSGIKVFFLESTWVLQYPLSLGIIEISDILKISYKNANAVLVFGIMSLFLRETFFISYYKIKLPRVTSYFVLAMVATFSTWGTLFSSIMTLHFACMAIGLLSVRAIHKKTVISTLLGYLALIVSLNLQSQLVYLPVLSYLYDFSERKEGKHLWLTHPSKQTILILCVCIAVFLISKQFYPPYGIYENYNSLVIGTREGLISALYSTIMFGTYLIPIIVVMGLVFLIIFPSNQTAIRLKTEHTKYNPFFIGWLSVLFLAGLFPYAAVGKYTFLLDFPGFSNRQAILLALPTSLLTALLLQYCYDKFANRLVRRAVLVAGTALLLMQVLMLTVSSVHKFNRQVFITKLETLMQLNSAAISPGLLEIVGRETPGPILAVYEANFLMYTATGKADWWVQIRRDKDATFTIPCHIQSNRDYQIKYVYNYKPEHIKNNTLVEVKVSGFRGILNSFRNVFRLNAPGLVELVNISSREVSKSQKNEVCN